MALEHIWRKVGCIVLLFLGLSSFLMAATQQQVVADIKALLNQQQYQAAYSMARQYQADYESLDEFDYVFAVAARSAGDLNASVFAFERVVQQHPTFIDARFGLALSYFDMGNLNAAKQELQLLSKHDLPAKLAAQITQYLNRIDDLQRSAQSNWHSWLQFGAGNDSNANNGVTDEFINIPALGQVNLFEQSREISSSYFDLQGQATYIHPIDQLSDIFASASVLHAQYSDNLIGSRTFTNLQTGYQRLYNQYQLSASLFYRPIWLDGDDYLNYYGLQFGVAHPLSAHSRWGVDLSFANQAYQQQPSLDKDQQLASVWFALAKSGGEHWFAFKVGTEGADQSRNDFSSRDMLGAAYRWQQQLNQQWSSTFSLEYQDAEYNGLNPLFLLVREDKLARAGIELSYQFNSRWSWNSQVMYLKNTSNIGLYEYSRVKLWTGAHYDF